MMFKRRNLFSAFLAPLAMKAVEHESAASFTSISGELLRCDLTETPNLSRSIIKYKKILQVPEITRDGEIIKYEFKKFGVTYIVDQGGSYEEL